jgi:hypothetical protein
MATTKPTRSSRSAQLHPAPTLSRIARPLQRPLKHPLWKLPAYETLHALNRDFEQILADPEKLRKIRLSPPEGVTTYQVMIQDIRAQANIGLMEVLLEREMGDAFRFDQLKRKREKYLEDPTDILIEAENLKKQRQKEAEKKAKRKKRV